MNRLFGAFLFLLSSALPVAAGQSCEERPVSAPELGRALALAADVRDRLNKDDHSIAVLGRVGSDVSDYGLRWTHAGLAYRNPGEGWRVLHKLNQCGRNSGVLFRQGLGNFFLDDPYEMRALVLIPNPETQERLRTMLAVGEAGRLHSRPYSMISNPWSRRFQNSNQWLLEVLAAAQDHDQRNTRKQAQRFLRLSGYRPGVIHVSGLERLGATLFRANISFEDHPVVDRLRNRYRVVTVESIEDYLHRNGWLMDSVEIRENGVHRSTKPSSNMGGGAT